MIKRPEQTERARFNDRNVKPRRAVSEHGGVDPTFIAAIDLEAGAPAERCTEIDLAGRTASAAGDQAMPEQRALRPDMPLIDRL